MNSIPFKREDDNIEGVGPGTYNPNISAVHKKAPGIKMVVPQPRKITSVNRIIKSISKNEMTINEQISTHKLKHENAVFASKTGRQYNTTMNPGPGSYEPNFEHKYIKNVPQGFGSTTDRINLVNR